MRGGGGASQVQAKSRVKRAKGSEPPEPDEVSTVATRLMYLWLRGLEAYKRSDTAVVLDIHRFF